MHLNPLPFEQGISPIGAEQPGRLGDHATLGAAAACARVARAGERRT